MHFFIRSTVKGGTMIYLLPILALFQICGCHPRTIKVSQSSSGTSAGVQAQGSGSIAVPGNLDVVVSGPGQGQGGVGAAGGGAFQVPAPGTSNVGLQCGSKTQMYPGNTVRVFSTNFGIAQYSNNEVCTWRFQANQCTLSAHCPCADIPKSWECLGDYLKISTDIVEKQRFCGGNKPSQPIYSDTDFLNIRFRSNAKNTAAGFTCFVRCEGPGMTLPIENMMCPTTTSLRGY